MLRPILLTFCLALPGGIAFAQAQTPPAGMQEGSGDGSSDAPAMERDEDHGSEHGDGQGMTGRMMRHHPGMMSMMGRGSKGFVLEMGDDRSLRVNCGGDPIGECVEAIRPLIDRLSDAE